MSVNFNEKIAYSYPYQWNALENVVGKMLDISLKSSCVKDTLA